MGKYTMTIREIQNSLNGSELLEKALSTYPLYKPKKTYSNIPNRSELNKRLLNEYKHREIGSETVGRFLEDLEDTMCEIMPYYNEMYKTIEIMADLENPFDNVDITETYHETRTGTATNENTATNTGEDESTVSGNTTNKTDSTDESSTNATVESTSKNVHSDTPQDSLSITSKQIDSVDYADEVSWNKTNNSDTATTTGESQSNSTTSNNQTANTTSTSTATNSGTQSMNDKTDESGTQTTNDTIEHTFTKKGNQGVNTYAHDMIEFRTSIIDVTNMIITDNRIKELFLMIF